MSPETRAFVLVLAAWLLFVLVERKRAARSRSERHMARMLAEHDRALERLANQLAEDGAELLARERRKGKAA